MPAWSRDGARYLGLDHDLGSLAPGKLADLAVIAGDPLDDIRVSERVRYVVLAGRVYDGATLDELAPREITRPPIFWRRRGGAPPTPGRSHGDACGCGRGAL